MATEIKLRRGTKAQHDDGSGFTGALGEVTVDTTDDTLRVHDGSLKGGHVIAKLSDVEASDTLAELLAKGNATSGTNLQISPSDDLLVSDTSKLKFETDGSNYLQIYKSAGTSGTSYIHEVGGGALVIKGESGYLRNDNDESQVTWNADGVTLGYNGSGVLDTTSTGINVTGTVEADNFLVDTGGYIAFEGAGSTDFASIRTVIDNDNGITNLDFRLGDDDADAFRWQFNHYNDGDTDYDTYMQLRADTSNPNKGVLTVSGTVTADGVTLGNNEKITLGAESDGKLEIYEATGGNGVIEQTGAGSLVLKGQNTDINNDANDLMIRAGVNEAALYHRNGDNAGKKLQTTNTGINVTGTVTADGLTLEAGEIATFNSGAGGDLQISGDATGSFSLIKQTGGGDLIIQGQNGHLRNDANDSLLAWDADNVNLSWQGATGAGTKLATTETGIDVTGTVTASEGVLIPEGKKLRLGSETDSAGLDIYESTDGDSLINQYGDGNLIVKGQNILLRNNSDQTLISTLLNTAQLFNRNGDNEGLKLETTNAGIDVTGTVKGLNFKHDNNDVTDQSWSSFARNGVSNALYVQQGATDKAIASFRKGSTQAAQGTEVLGVSQNGINVTGTVEADAFSGTGNTAITDFVTDVSTNNNDTTVPTTAAVKSYVDNNDGDTTYTGGTGLTLDGTTFNVDAAQTQITSVGTLTGLTTGATTVNGALTVNNDEMSIISSDTGATAKPTLKLTRNSSSPADNDVLGSIEFRGENSASANKVYGSMDCVIVDEGTGVGSNYVKGQIRFSVATGLLQTSNQLETPAFTIDQTGVYIGNENGTGLADANYYNMYRGQGLQAFGASQTYNTKVTFDEPTANRSIKIPDVGGTVVVAGMSGGDINGGGGLNSPKTAWSLAEFQANPNVLYTHYNASNSNDLVVAVPFAGVDIGSEKYGNRYIFTNTSSAGSEIVIDLNGFTYSGTQYYSTIKYDGGTNATITSASSNLVVAAGGTIELIPVTAGVFIVTGIGYS